MAGDFKDLRYLFMRGLIDHEKSQRSRHYLKSAAECTSRAVVSLELAPDPITNFKQAKRLEGIGGETCTRLAKLDEERNFSSLKPLPGRFVSSAGAILVTLLDLTVEKARFGNSKSKDILIHEEAVKAQSRFLCEEHFIEPNDEGFCTAWWRLEVLIKRGYIERRSQKKKSVLQLLPAGQVIAQRLKGVNGQRIKLTPEMCSKDGNLQELNPLAEAHTSTESTSNESLTRKSIYTNDEGKEGLVMLVDTQEMGGERAGLGELCRLLDQNGVNYRTKKLPTGDYSWIWRCGDDEVTLPCLVERKRADDIPCTLKEGRFWSQINKMLDWKRGFTDRGIDCNLHYILERKPEEYVVKCTDGCMGIGQCGNPTLSQIKMVIEDLKHHPELLVKETDSLEITAVLLKSLTNELEQRALMGDFDMLIQRTSRLNPPIKAETEPIQTTAMPETDLSFDEQLKLALANSLKDTGAKPKCEERGISNYDRMLDDKNNDRNIERSFQTNKVQRKSGIHDEWNDEPLIDTPMMQYHCTVETSVTCQQFDKGTKVDEYKNEYRPKINRKRIHNSPLADVSATEFGGESSKKSRKTNFRNVEDSEVGTSNLCPANADLKGHNKETPVKLAEFKTVRSSVYGTKLDKTDEILESLKQTSVIRSSCDKVFNQARDNLEKKEYKPKVRLKPIKMSLSPSKLFIETNIVKVKEQSLSPLKSRQSKSIKTESGFSKLNSEEKDTSIDKSLQIENSAMYSTGINNPRPKITFVPSETHSVRDVNTCPKGSIAEINDYIDNVSTKSIEDIFADTSSQESVSIPANEVEDKTEDISEQECGRKVSDWLLNECTSSTPKHNTDSSGIKDTKITVSYSSDDSNHSRNSLPDLDLKPDTASCPDGNDNLVGAKRENDVVIIDDDDLVEVSRPGPSKTVDKPKQKKARKAHDSGYESEGFRQRGTTGAANNDLPASSSDCVLESKEETVLGILPHLKRYQVTIALKACDFNVEQCISFLLDQNEIFVTEGNSEKSVIDLTE